MTPMHDPSMTQTSPTNPTMTTMSSQPPSCLFIRELPHELHVNILTYLRAYDLSAVQLTCRFFADPNLTHAIVRHTAEHVYPPELTKGHDTPIVSGCASGKMTYEALRNMEMLVVARLLSRPEPKDCSNGFYVSKSWCRTALKWLEVQQEERQLEQKKRKLSKKQLRLRNRRLSDASPPWPNVNSDIVCSHLNLQKANSKQARARRKLLDKQAWKVLKKLYPDSTQLDSVKGECLQCCLEQETARKNEENRAMQEKEERKRPLGCPLVRAVYTRSRGVPLANLVKDPKAGQCPLQPGLYVVLPRAWCHAWRRYLKHGSGDAPCAPNATALLCDAHRLPLIPPHLEAYLYGKTNLLLCGASHSNNTVEGPNNEAASPVSNVASMPVVGLNPVQQPNNMDHDMVTSLRAVGMTASEVASQRMAMMTLERNNNNVHQIHSLQGTPPQDRRHLSDGEQLDRENKVVVEILSEQEYTALEKWWPKSHSNFCLRFAVQDGGISWSTPPCRECDASRHYNRNDLVVRNRARGWVKKSTVKSAKSPASLEY